MMLKRFYKTALSLILLFSYIDSYAQVNLSVGITYSISGESVDNLFRIEIPFTDYEQNIFLPVASELEDEGQKYISTIFNMRSNKNDLTDFIQNTSSFAFSESDLDILWRGINNWNNYDEVFISGEIDFPEEKIYVIGMREDTFSTHVPVVLRKEIEGFSLPNWRNYNELVKLALRSIGQFESSTLDYQDNFIEDSQAEGCFRFENDSACIIYADLDVELLETDRSNTKLGMYVENIHRLVEAGESISELIDERAYLFNSQSPEKVLTVLENILNNELLVQVDLNGYVFIYTGEILNETIQFSRFFKFKERGDEIYFAQTLDYTSLDDFFESEIFKNYLRRKIQ